MTVNDVADINDVSSPTDPGKRGRPALEPTQRITLRLPVSTMEILNRRAAKAHMVPSVYLAERVIHHEVVRRHYLTKAERKN